MLRPHLSLTPLEDRLTPVAWGNPWPIPRELTVSFAPDGTNVSTNPAAPVPSRLSAHLSGLGESAWQTEILRAVQSWSAAANLDVSLSPDDGAAFGGGGPIQGSPLRGDLRVAARPLASREVAVATPFDLSGRWAGEIVFNTNSTFGLNGSAGYDLFTVALHEVGHALGLGPSADPLSAMAETYSGPRAGLAPSDVAAIQALYGARPADRFDAVGLGNNSALTASPLGFVADAARIPATDGGARAPFVARGDISPGDRDFFRVAVPFGARDVSVELRTAGEGLLRPKVSLYDAVGRLVDSWTANDVRAGTLSVPFLRLRAGTYFVSVEAAGPAAFAAGGYRLAVGTQAATAVDAAPAPVADDGKDDSPAGAKDKGVTRPNPDALWDVADAARIETAADRDFLKFRTAKAGAPGALVLTVWAAEGSALDPVVRVTKKDGLPVRAEVLTNERGVYTLQVRDAAPDTEYRVEIAATDAGVGDYFFAADWRVAPIATTAVAAGKLDGASQSFATSIERSELVQFTLAADAAGADVSVSIVDAFGRVVGVLTAAGGDSASASFLLGPGTYTVIATSPVAGAAFALTSRTCNDPMLPELEDPYFTPASRLLLDAQMSINTVEPLFAGWDDPWGDTYAGW